MTQGIEVLELESLAVNGNTVFYLCEFGQVHDFISLCNFITHKLGLMAQAGLPRSKASDEDLSYSGNVETRN